MSFLLDTNVISEIRKGPRAHHAVLLWWRRHRQEGHFLSVLAVAELRRGIEQLQRRDAPRAASLDAWLRRVQSEFAERIIPVNLTVAERYGRLQAKRTLPVADALMAATALVYGLTMVTCNVRDYESTGVRVLNPFF